MNINDALQSAPTSIKSHLSLFGTATIRFVHSWKPVEASIENLDLPRSLIFNYHMTNSPGSGSGEHTFQGLWWRSTDDTRGFLALSNLGSAALMPSYEVLSKTGEAIGSGYVKLSPHATEVVDLTKLIARTGDEDTDVGGITVQYRGQDGGLGIAAGLEDDNVGFSAILPFSSTDVQKDSKAKDMTIASVGLMVGKPDPMAGFPEKLRFSLYGTLHNNSEKSLAVTIAANYMNGGNPTNLSLAEMQLRPHETVELRMKEMLAAAGLAHFDGMLNLSYAYKGLENDLLIANGSIDQTGNYVFSVLPVPIGTSAGRAVNYWSVENGFDTMINLWNPAGQPENLLLTLHYADGTGEYDLPVSLAANASTMVGLVGLISVHQPDAKGNLISSTATHGSLEIISAKNPTQIVTFVMSSAVFNAQTGTCNPNCQSCPGFTSAGISPGSVSLPIGNSEQVNSSVTWYNGNVYNETGSTSWTTTNPPIASFDGSIAGLAWGNSAGGSPLNFFFTSPPYISQICNSSCPSSNISGPIEGMSYQSVQHSYPRNPLPQTCWITRYFDAVMNQRA